MIISYVGRLEKRKGSKILIKLLEFFKNSKKIKFVFCGFNEEQFFQHSGKKFENLKCLGFINNVEKVLENCDILLLPSLHEGMPYSILEAMSKSVLVIGNDIPGIRSLIKDGYNGYLIKNNNLDLYKSLIISLLNEEINVKKLIYNNFKIIEKYNRSSFMLEYENFLKRV